MEIRNNKHLMIKRIFFSCLLCIYGLYIVDIYNVDLMQSVQEEINGFQKVISLTTGSSEFFKVLRNNITFNAVCNIFEGDSEKLIIFYLVFYLDIYKYLSIIITRFIYNDPEDIPIKTEIILKAMDIVPNFFLSFISNHFLVIFFTFLPSITYKEIYNSFMSFYLNIISNAFLTCICVILGVIIIILIWLLLVGIILIELMEIIVLCFIFCVIGMFRGFENLPLWLTIGSLAVSHFGVKIYFIIYSSK